MYLTFKLCLFMDEEQIFITCNACQKQEQVDNWGDVRHHSWNRHDHYGLSTGCYCDDCYENNYPYRRDAYFDPSYCGERMEDDY